MREMTRSDRPMEKYVFPAINRWRRPRHETLGARVSRETFASHVAGHILRACTSLRVERHCAKLSSPIFLSKIFKTKGKKVSLSLCVRSPRAARRCRRRPCVERDFRVPPSLHPNVLAPWRFGRRPVSHPENRPLCWSVARVRSELNDCYWQSFGLRGERGQGKVRFLRTIERVRTYGNVFAIVKRVVFGLVATTVRKNATLIIS